MPAGFQVIGTHGAIQIDENFFNMAFIQKGSGTFSASPGNSVAGTATIVINGSTPVIAIRGLDSFSLVEYVDKSGSAYTYTLRGDPGKSFTWYLFDKMPSTASGSGLEVRNSAGTPTFNSNYPPMIVSSIGVFSAGNPLNNPLTITTSTGVYAVCFSGVGRLSAVNSFMGGSGTFFFKDGIKITNTGAVSSDVRVAAIPTIVSQANSSSGNQVLLVDVKGL